MKIKNDDYFMQVAYKEAKKAYEIGEIPVGTVIILNEKIISKGHNLRDTTNIVTKHAEIIAIEKANKKLKNWRLNECIMYTTLQPCNMCMSVIKSSKIKKIIFAARSNERSDLLIEERQIINKVMIDKSVSLIQKAFLKIRKNKIKKK